MLALGLEASIVVELLDEETVRATIMRHESISRGPNYTTASADGVFGTHRPVIPHERAILAGILVLALAVRLVFIFQMRSSPYFAEPGVDQRFFVDSGHAFAHGQAGAGLMFRPPLYGWWLGLIFKVFGDDLLMPRLIQAILGVGTVWLVHRVATRVFDSRVGIAAAVLAATYWTLIYYDAELLRESLVNPANLLATLLTLNVSGRPSSSKSALAGAAWGLSALLRPQVLVLVPFLGLWLFFHSRIGFSRVALFLVTAPAVILPVAAYNQVVGNDWLSITAEGGQALWSGNNPAADGVTSTTPGMRGDFWGFYEDSRARAELEEGRALLPSGVSRHYSAKAFSWAIGEPRAAARLLLRKLRLFWMDWEFGNPEEPRFFAERFAPIVRWLPLGFGLAAGLAFLGFLACCRKGFVPTFPVWCFVLVYGATVVLVLVSSRYRLPVVPFMLILAANGLVWLGEQVAARRALALIGGVAIVSLAYFWSTSFPVPRDASAANGLTWLGIAEARTGRRETTITLFEEAIERFPANCDAHINLGVILVEMKHYEQALQHLQRAIALCPENVTALDAEADLLLKLGRTQEARAMAERSIAVAPHLARARYNLGRSLVASRQLEAAREAFRAALSRQPEYFNAAYALGVVSLELGLDEEAIQALSKAVADRRSVVDQEFLVSAYRALIDSLLRLGRQAEARRYAEQMDKQLPGSVEARRILERL